ncbi:uncharacterized protein LOC127804264 [Diospyros lotus]|uniref:uncharacterized protein LOC127804264 n=1 Tax=Diospyros lotus TaxID=55363 RepID=UPI002252D63B|nr:uncharacterized protein LOC127804264 [Diospyros lotus]
MFAAGNEDISEELRALAQGPNCVARKYKGFIINGFRFRVKEVEEKRKTQNSGVIVTAKTESYANVRDNNPISGDVTYYGVLNDILELDYLSGKKVTLFNCDWVSQRSGKKEDDDGFTLVNFTRLMPTDEPFILASQAQQVFYVEDPTEKDWHVVIRTTPRDQFDQKVNSCEDDIETQLQSHACNPQIQDGDINVDITWAREHDEFDAYG